MMSKTRKEVSWKSIIVLAILLLSSMASGLGIISDDDGDLIKQYATEAFEDLLEYEINSSFYRLQNIYDQLIVQVGLQIVQINGTTMIPMDYDVSRALVTDWAVGNQSAANPLVFFDKVLYDLSPIPAGGLIVVNNTKWYNSDELAATVWDWDQATMYTASAWIMDDGRFLATNLYKEVLYIGANQKTCIQTALNYTTMDAGGVIRYNGLTNPRLHRFATMYIGPGRWNIGATRLHVPVHVTVTGAMYRTVIKNNHAKSIFKAMWPNFTYGVEIRDIIIQGSGIPNNVRGIDWDQTTANIPGAELSSGMINIDRVGIFGCSWPFYGKTTSGLNGGVKINDLRAFGTIYWERIFDSRLGDSGFGTLELNGACTSNTFRNLYIGGGRNFNLWIHGDADRFSTYKTSFDNVRFDNPTKNYVILEGFAETLLFDGCWFTNAHDNVNGTNSGFIIGPNNHHITITGSHFSNNQAGLAKPSVFKFLIREADGSHSNVFVGNSYEDNQYWGIPLFTRMVNGSGLYNTHNVSLSNFENRKQTFRASIDSDVGAVTKNWAAIGQSTSSATAATRSLYWMDKGTITNFRVAQDGAPGATDRWSHYIYTGGAVRNLNVTIINAETNGLDHDSFYFDADQRQGTYLVIRSEGSPGADTAIRFGATWDFYPRAEDVVGLPGEMPGWYPEV